VAERRAIVTRIDADLDWLASDLTSSLAGLADRTVSDQSRRALIAAAADAAGGTQIEAAVAGSHRHRGALAVGWPLLRWIRNAKPDPLSRLGLGGLRSTSRRTADPSLGGGSTGPVAVRRTAIAADPIGQARLDEAVRHLAHEAGHGLPETARREVEAVVNGTRDGLPDALDEAAGRTDLRLDPPGWWRLLGGLQWLGSAALVVGLLWLLVLWVLAWFAFPQPPTPRWRDVPLPSLLTVGGAVLGLLVATIGRRLTAVGARRRGRQARAALTEQVAEVIDRDVVAPVNTELLALAQLRQAIQRL